MRRAIHQVGTALRETGQAIDRIGLTAVGREPWEEFYSRHRPIMNLFDKHPKISLGSFIAPNASVIGNVFIKTDASVWYGAVIRGDQARVVVGVASNIQDRAVINTTPTRDDFYKQEVVIGSHVVVGHGAIITSSSIEDNVLIGQGAIIQEGSYIENGAVVAAGAVVLPGTFIRKNQLYAGNPAVYIRDVSEEEQEETKKIATNYVTTAQEHSTEFLDIGHAYQQVDKI